MTSPHDKQAWLEVEGGGATPKTVHCPRQAKDVPLRECLGCKRYLSLTIDPPGKHIFIDCAWNEDD